MKLNESVSISLKEGLLVKFNSDAGRVEYCCSLMTGRDAVKVDGVIVSRGMNYKARSVHRFDINGKSHSIEFLFISIMNGKYEIRMFEEAIVKQGYRLSYVAPAKEGYIKNVIPVGMTLIFTSVCMAGVWLISIGSAVLFSACVVLVSLLIVLEYFARRSEWRCENIEV